MLTKKSKVNEVVEPTTVLSAMQNLANPGDDTSKAGTLDSIDYKKILRDTLVAAASAGIAVLINYTASLDLGVYTVAVIPVINMLLTTSLKFVKGVK